MAWSLQLNQNSELRKLSSLVCSVSRVPLLVFSILVQAVEKFTFSHGSIFEGRTLSKSRVPADPHLLDVLEIKFEYVFDEALTSKMVLLKLEV